MFLQKQVQQSYFSIKKNTHIFTQPTFNSHNFFLHNSHIFQISIHKATVFIAHFKNCYFTMWSIFIFHFINITSPISKFHLTHPNFISNFQSPTHRSTLVHMTLSNIVSHCKHFYLFISSILHVIHSNGTSHLNSNAIIFHFTLPKFTPQVTSFILTLPNFSSMKANPWPLDRQLIVLTTTLPLYTTKNNILLPHTQTDSSRGQTWQKKTSPVMDFKPPLFSFKVISFKLPQCKFNLTHYKFASHTAHISPHMSSVLKSQLQIATRTSKFQITCHISYYISLTIFYNQYKTTTHTFL